jgi:hypothetical protein
MGILTKPKNAAKSWKRWFFIRDLLRVQMVVPFLMIESCPKIRELANRKPSHNVYLKSVGLPVKWNPKALAPVNISKMPNKIRGLFCSSSTRVSRREFFRAITRASSNPNQAAEAGREYLTAMYPMD